MKKRKTVKTSKAIAKKAKKQVARPCWECTHLEGIDQPWCARFIDRAGNEKGRLSESYERRAMAISAIKSFSNKPIRREQVEIGIPDNVVDVAPIPPEQPVTFLG